VCLVTEFPLVLDGRVLNQAYTLSRAGYRVTIVDQSVPRHPDPLAALRNRLPSWAQNGCRVLRMAANDAPLRGSLFRTLQKPARPVCRWLVTRTLLQLRADAYQARSVETLRTVVPAARRTGAKIVYDVRDFDTPHLLQERSTRKRRHVVDAEHRAVPHVAVMTTVNSLLASAVATYYKVPLPEVILNCKLVASELPRNVRDLRSELGLSEQTPLLVFTGTTAFARGFSVMINAAARLSKAHIAFVGVHDPSGELTRLATRAGAAGRVSFHPPVPALEVPAYIRSADAAIASVEPVNANQLSALPNKVFEAIAAHLPLIVSDIPEQRRIVETYGLGVVFEPADADDLVRAIEAVLADRERFRRNTIEASRELCWEREGEKLLSIYRGVVGAP